jgi:AraC-like DNA-binding protein
MLKGTGSISREGKCWAAGTGDWIVGTTQPHHQQFSDDARILSLNFKVEWPSGDSLIDEPLVFAAAQHPEFERAARAVFRIVQRHFPGIRNDLWGAAISPATFFKLHEVFSRWMAAYLDLAQTSGILPSRMAGLDPRILASLRYLDRRPWAAPFLEKELADAVGLSVSHLNRLFTQQLSLTPRAYLQKRRFESAISRLRGTEQPVKNIAWDLGFSSPGHFCHWFRRLSGQSPQQLRTSK